MKSTRRRDTQPELAVRRNLHRAGYRYLVDTQPLPGVRRRADIVFTKARLAVFVDGCFWHSCPVHGTWPRANSEWWRAKIEANVGRDRDTDQRLANAGWCVIRIWEHEDPSTAAARVAAVLERS